MISLSIIILACILAGGVLVSNRNKYGFKKIVFPVAILIVALCVAIFQPFVLNRVDAGHVGIKVNLTGDQRGVSGYEYKTGWVVYNSWVEQMYEFPTFQQHIEYDTIQTITRGGFAAKITPSFNYSLIPTAVGDMFQNLRLPIEQVQVGWLKNAIYSSVNDVANKWSVDSIFNHREQFESAIINECNKRCSKWFVISQLRSNIMPPPALQASILAKTKAIQDVQVAEGQKLVAIADALRKIAIARGDSAKKMIEANADAQSVIIDAKATAEAMKLKQMQLSSLYVDYIRASSWDGKLPTTILGNSSSTLFNIK